MNRPLIAAASLAVLAVASAAEARAPSRPG